MISIPRPELGQGKTDVPCPADHRQDWHPYPDCTFMCNSMAGTEMRAVAGNRDGEESGKGEGGRSGLDGDENVDGTGGGRARAFVTS